MNEITIGDKTYISSKRAAEITGYAKDYVGQLCREGYVDAKMVGRSWYVYEPSIRAHRFGEEAVEEPAREVDEHDGKEESANEAVHDPEDILATWEEPRYQAEQPVQIPSLDIQATRSVNRLEDSEYAPEAALTDMQKAWKEWFELRNQSPEPEIREEDTIEDPQNYSEDTEDVYEEEVVEIHRVPEPVYEPEEGIDDSEEEEIRIERVYRREVQHIEPDVTAARAPAAPPRKKPQTRAKQSEGVAASIAALFIAIAILSLSVAAIGSGIATPYLQPYVGSNPVLDFLGGTRVINN